MISVTVGTFNRQLQALHGRRAMLPSVTQPFSDQHAHRRAIIPVNQPCVTPRNATA